MIFQFLLSMKIPTNIRGILFALTMLLYLWFPYQLSRQRDRVLEHGAVYRFRLQNMESQNLSGSYVDLYYDVPAELATEEKLYQHQTAYVRLSRDSAGFTHISDAMAEPPSTGDYLAIEVIGLDSSKIYFSFPDNMRYFYFDTPHPTPEPIRPQPPRRQQWQAYAEVRVWKGKGIVENLYIENQPVQEFLQAEKRKE